MASSSTSPQIYGKCPAPIKRLLRQWHQELAEATKRLRPYEELPYWYNERANVGYVAQAVSKLGFAVVEEYTVHRGEGNKVHPGRADLWFGDDLKDEYIVEFKQHWASIQGDDKTLTENIVWCLNAAQKQLLAIEATPARRPSKVAMVFVGPWVAKSDRSRWKELLGPFLKRITRPADYGSEFSTVFVPPDDLQGSKGRAIDDYLYPAMAVFGRVVPS